MLSLSVPDVRDFMGKLFKEAVFDGFETRSVSISTVAHFQIDGEKTQRPAIPNVSVPVAAPDDEVTGSAVAKIKSFCSWQELRPYAFAFIRGTVRPTFFKIVLSCRGEIMSGLSENAGAMFLNITLEGEAVRLTTGVSQKTFLLDKTHETAWDSYVESFLANSGIKFVSEL